jgi:hypothetical protein
VAGQWAVAVTQLLINAIKLGASGAIKDWEKIDFDAKNHLFTCWIVSGAL